MRVSRNHIKFCPEHYTEIENYELAKADNFVNWICHHRNGEQFSKDWLIRNNMYYNRSDPHEFKFVTLEEHGSIKHAISKSNPGERNGMYGKHHTEEAKRKMSENHCEVTWGSYGFAGKKHSEETKAKMREAAKRRWANHRSSKELQWQISTSR